MSLNGHALLNRLDLLEINFTRNDSGRCVRWVIAIHAPGIRQDFSPRIHYERMSITASFAVVRSKLCGGNDETLILNGARFAKNIVKWASE